MKIVSIVVTFNGMKWIDRCLGSLLASSAATDVLVIDNLSTDGTPDHIRTAFPEVTLVQTGENLGFAMANNLGMRRALDSQADCVFLLNQDAWVEQDTIATLAGTLQEHADAAIASPMHLNGAGTALDSNFARGCMPSSLRDDLASGKCAVCYETHFVNAAAWLVFRRALETVGGFDTSLFRHYGEDDNYCQRVRFHKMKILINTTCTVCHDRAQRPADHQGRTIWAGYNTEYKMKMALGDLNKDVNICREKYLQFRSMAKSLVLCRFGRAKESMRRIRALSAIKASRRTNAAPGPHWL